MEMFSGFPAFMAGGDDEIRMTMASYLEIINEMPEDVVADACFQFSKRSTRFPPNRGEVFQRCQDILAKKTAERAREVPRLPKPEFTEAHREKMKAKFQALVDELKSEKNFKLDYGRVEPGSLPQKPIVERTVPGSWLDKWERDNDRPYFGLARAAE
jgi:hypothetical protein